MTLVNPDSLREESKLAFRIHTEPELKYYGPTGVYNSIWNDYVGTYPVPATLSVWRRRYLLATTQIHPDGWREPTPYGAFNITCQLHQFDYDVLTSNGTTWKRLGGFDNYAESLMTPYMVRQSINFGQPIGRTYVWRPVVSKDTLDQAYTEALAKAARRKITLTTEAAELGKSIQTLADRFRKLVAALVLIKRGRFADAWRMFGVRTWRSGAETWLEWQYGWKPMINTVQSALELVEKGLDERPTFHVTRTIRKPLPDPHGYFHYIGEEGCKVRFDFELKDRFKSNQNQVGLSLQSMIETGWELLPFSFVVDWVIPIGTFIQSLGATQGLTFKGGSNTRWVRNFIEDTWFANGSDRKLLKGKKPSCTIRSFAVVRDVQMYPPLGPRLYMKFPFSSPQRLLSLASLVAVLSSNHRQVTPGALALLNQERIRTTNQYREWKYNRAKQKKK